VEYSPGYYPAGICAAQSCNGQNNNPVTFDPGIYYMGGDLTADRNACLRVSTAAGQGIGGVMFYFSGNARVNIASNSGRGCDPAQPFSRSGIYCGSNIWPPSSSLPASFNGNVLLAPCTGTYGDPNGASPPNSLGPQRGILFFQDRAATGVQANAGGGGSSLLAGAIYFHSCNSAGTGTSCSSAPTYFSDVLTVSGSPGGGGGGNGLYLIGSIVVDNLVLGGGGGNSAINIYLNPTTGYSLLKASLLQ
jgi:hypothetical protein